MARNPDPGSPSQAVFGLVDNDRRPRVVVTTTPAMGAAPDPVRYCDWLYGIPHPPSDPTTFCPVFAWSPTSRRPYPPR